MSDSSFHDRIDQFFIGRIRRDSSFDMGASHYHPYYEIYYVLSGQCRCFIGHSIYLLFPGDMVLIPPGILHKMLYESKRPTERLTLSFTPEYVSSFRESCGAQAWEHIFCRMRLTLPSSMQAPFLALAGQLEAESAGADAYAPALSKSLLYQLLTMIGRSQDASQKPQLLDQAQTAIQESARYIYEHYEENITLFDAARAAHMNPTYFSRKFKESTGFGFKEYLTHIRMQKAAQLLLDTDASVTEIAGICGFSDSNYFGDAFGRHFGMSPRSYRKSRRENGAHP
ncbi:MAG: AraC family transcriptional regulator [Roseburia sp.]|nr:AraC family transcriptional regulator [Roseburia sp.]